MCRLGGIATAGAGSKDGIYEQIREDILLGRLGPGERLTEERLARQFDVSRTPVREVLGRLGAEGLVDLTPFRGAVVRPFGVHDLESIYDLRYLLESYAAGRAAIHLTETDLDEIDQLNAEYASDAQIAVERGMTAKLILHAVGLNQQLHAKIIAACRNDYLAQTIQHIIQLPLVYRSMQFYGPEGFRVSSQQHQELTEAFHAHDAGWAESVMRVHIIHGRNILFSHLDALAETKEES